MCAFVYRIVKKLQVKNQKQIDLERKEQGFTLYLNGANTRQNRQGKNSSHKTNSATPKTTRPKSHKPKTAGGKLVNIFSKP